MDTSRCSSPPWETTAVDSIHLESKDVESKDVESKDVESKDVESKDVERIDGESQTMRSSGRGGSGDLTSPIRQRCRATDETTAETTAEKIFSGEVSTLSDTRLLQALGIRTAVPAVVSSSVAAASDADPETAAAVIDRLGAADPIDFLKLQGVGRQRAVQLAVAVEVGRRATLPRWRTGSFFHNPQQVFDHCSRRLSEEKREFFMMIMLDSRNRLLGEKIISIGSLASSIVHPREVFRGAIRLAAASILVVHNHPSGDPGPSDEDLAVTRRLHQCGLLLGIQLVDHIILGRGEWRSLRNQRCGPWSGGKAR
ncbi:MAG: DNA repair protein RadC [Planctomycetes bacterium]|nr:DNA repair protein RadC [Planctomycetota bacterium]